MCLLGPEGSNAAWLAAALSRLGTSDTMSALTANLCAAVAAHVKRRFVLDAHVTAALVPPGPDVPLALLLQPSAAATAAAASNGNVSNLGAHSSLSLTAVGGAHAGVGINPTRSGEGLAGGGFPANGAAVGAKLVCRSPAAAGGRSSSVNVALFAQQQLGTTPPSAQSQQDLGGLSAAMSKRRLRPVGGTPTSSLLRDPAALICARFSLDLSPRTRAAGSIDIPRSPSLGPTASSRSIVIPLNNPHHPQPNKPSQADGSPYTAAAAAAAAMCSPCTPTLHAKAFPLQRTLLQAHLQHLQRQARLRSGRQQPSSHVLNPRVLASSEATVGEQVATVGSVAAVSAPSATAVIEDTQLHVQNVHKPSGDVCMLMGLTRKTANGMLGGGGGLSGMGVLASSHGPPWATATGMSLVLLVAPLGEEGAALGLYLCFPKRLPGLLLEAVRGSCQELMDKALAPVIRTKLKGAAIAPEFETLCSASPGSYAVVRSPSFCGSQAPAALSAACMSTVTGSDLGPAVGGPEAAAAAGASPSELLSGELSTADMEVLLALQAQAQAGGSVSAGRRSGQDRTLAATSSTQRGSTAACMIGGGGSPGAIAMAGRAAVAPHHSASPLSVRCTGTTERRALTASGLGPLGTAGGGGGAVATAGAECVEPLSLSQLLQSNPNDVLAGFSHQAPPLRTGSSRSLVGLENGGAGCGGGGLFTTAHIITVSAVDNAATARQQLDLLVSSIYATINTDHAAGGTSSSPMDDLDALELGDVLGQGGGGTVFKGKLGTLDVAVKLMEMPKVDPSADSVAAAQRKGTAAPAAQAGTGGVNGGGGGKGEDSATAAADKICLNARREMLRNATELAVQSRVSHPNIVQIYATYNDVVMVSKKGPPGYPGSTCRLYPAALNCPGPNEGDSNAKGTATVEAGLGGPGRLEMWRADVGVWEFFLAIRRRHVPCVAAAFELCDCGSLGGALSARTFPKAVYRERDADGAIPLRAQFMVDMKGVYMTLLDVALALRHLHSLHLVHRDVKPANLLLKSNPRDPRGFTVKLADFGFVLHLNETAEDGSRYAIADQACGTVTHMAPEALLASILMWEMFSGGVRPYPRLQPDKIPRAVYRGARPTFSDDIPAAYRNLALACWSTDPHRRPRASDVVVLLNGLLLELE
ncbi:hypothetical protein VOLCADRAFT_119072 [Volvox carteri f. nagariensis]|uniref:Protein kinase domain-containing protein n=1 Tax=Volvox carteri f. nagariensis TaxID=3068 RepID=D8U9U8_VOLCA|nr:uncharacterized protein VOLCADRAFT_119072 [Volvox carteri f. nagariensis]EFJ43535.1 hypothetical protein VOLCADRAFT_119072 [Volvox carteri f. nagariensis]|eukprot:XP_002955464.1 hypothetical protein VOLCADRAFT_119072 [Volvox carteri f. nagariensis]